MFVNEDTVTFEKSDMHFVQKFGVMKATEMVLDFTAVHRHPFIYDTYQLAAFFGMNRKQLFAIVGDCIGHYHPVTIQKKNGGIRRLDVPEHVLKHMQRRILDGILSTFPVSGYATAYRPGGRILDNASVHCGKKYLLKLDLADFFGSICFAQVYSAAFNRRHFPPQIGAMLTTLCCRADVLPQGAPTSPALSNLVLRHFDDVMGAWCEKRGIAYTRYCDDITFSGNIPLYTAYQKAVGLLTDMGFVLNDKKTRFLTNASRQTVTGLTVNEKISVPQDYKRKLRQELYYALKYGLEDAIVHAGKTEYMEKGIAQTPRYYHHLVGQLLFVLQIEPENAYFRKALAAIHQLYANEEGMR